MFFTWNVHAAVSLLALLRISVCASLENVVDRKEVSANKIVDYVNLPWMEASDWLLHSSESSRVEEVRAFIRGVDSGEIWALEMLDALWKIQQETPQKIIREIGTHDQSIEVNAQDEPLASELGPGASDLPFARVELKDLATVEIATIIFFMTIGAFIIGCTICDIVRRSNHRRKLSSTVMMLSKFSLYTNALDILSTKVTPDIMPAIQGIRCLSCCSVVIGHRFLISVLGLGKSITLLELLKNKNSWLGLYVQITPYAVDTFFVISGFLAAYLFFKSMQSGMKFNLPMMYLKRYLRITPCVAIVMLFATVLLHRAGSGSAWAYMVTRLNNNCHESWWIHFLYVQNLVENGTLCLPHCWYLATDMQLFWMSPFILYSLHKWPRIGITTLRLCFLASILTPAVTLAINGYSNTMLRLDVDDSKWLENYGYYYVPTYNRACPYLVGLLLGYDVATKRRRLSQMNVVINWFITGTLLLFGVWFTNRIYNTNFAYDLYSETGFAAAARPSWAFAMAWIIYACTQGYGGIATRFLSLPIFFPLSRLTFCIYLVHFCVQAIMIVPLETSGNYLDVKLQLYGVCIDLVISIAVAFVLNLFIESPVIIFSQTLMNRHLQAEKAMAALEELKKKNE